MVVSYGLQKSAGIGFARITLMTFAGKSDLRSLGKDGLYDRLFGLRGPVMDHS